MRHGLLLALAAAAVGVVVWMLCADFTAETPPANAPPVRSNTASPSPAAPAHDNSLGLADPGARVGEPGPLTESSTVAPEPTGTLVVSVIARGKQTPLPQARLFAREHAGDEPALSLESTGGPGVSPVTDANGIARIVWPAGRPFELEVVGESTTAGRALHSIPALEANEERALTVELPVEYDLVFCGRVVADENGEPLAHARVAIVGADSAAANAVHAEAETDLDGFFAVRVPSWALLAARVEVADRPVVFAVVTRRHEHPLTATEIRVPRWSALDVRVVGREVSVGGLDVRLVAGDSTWEKVLTRLEDRLLAGDRATSTEITDAGGRCRFERVAPFRATEIEVSRESVPLLRTFAPALPAGEVRVLELLLTPGFTLKGDLRDEYTGAAIADAAIWVVPDMYGGQYEFDHFAPTDRPIAVARTDARGVFEFVGVQPGYWFVGLAPDAETDLASEARQIELWEDRDDVVLTASRGFALRGRVVGSGGGSVAGTCVRTAGLEVVVGEDGEFVLEPVRPREQHIEAIPPSGSGFAAGSESAKPADRGVAIVLPLEGVIRARFVDEHGEPLAGWLRADGTDLDSVFAAERREFLRDGRLELSGLASGKWTLTFLTDQNLLTRTRLETYPGRTIDAGVVVATPAGVLVVVDSAPTRAATELWEWPIVGDMRGGFAASPRRGLPEPLLPGDYSISIWRSEDSGTYFHVDAGERVDIDLATLRAPPTADDVGEAGEPSAK